MAAAKATPQEATVPLNTSDDVVLFRQRVRSLAVDLGFSLLDQTKLVTAASEIGRNALIYGGGGEAVIQPVSNGTRLGLRVCVSDRGPGIADIDAALRPGFSTGSGLGLGLSGTRRLVHEFDIRSDVGDGTVVSILRWR